MADVVVITGAAGALGADVSVHLASRGYRTALLDTPHGAERLRALAMSIGDDSVAIEADITKASEWTDILRVVEAKLGAPTHAVLIAGGWQGGTPLHAETDDTRWRSMLDSNLETAHSSLRALLPGMVARKHGSIVLIGSQVVERPWAGAGATAYAASKAAVVAMARAAAQEVLEYGVRINTILPSTLDTPANRNAMPKADPARWVATTSAAEVITFLLSDAARDVSGAALPVYGRS